MSSRKNTDATAEVAPVDMTTMQTWDDAFKFAAQIVDASQAFGDGAVLLNKKDIVGKGEFLILDWREVLDKNTLREYVSVLAINRENVRFRFNDGSTGIAKQLREFGQLVPGQTIYVKMMTKSEYTTEIDGRIENGTTYYLS